MFSGAGSLTCGPVPPLEHGAVELTALQAAYTCNKGFTMAGPDKRVCSEETKLWQPGPDQGSNTNMAVKLWLGTKQTTFSIICLSSHVSVWLPRRRAAPDLFRQFSPSNTQSSPARCFSLVLCDLLSGSEVAAQTIPLDTLTFASA